MAAKNPAKYFIRKDVTDILYKLTGMDNSKIFKPSFNPALKKSDIKLLTAKQLEIENEKALKKAKKLLQMPPFLPPRVTDKTVLQDDPKLNPLNLKKTDFLFIDISMNIPNKKRSIVVRQADGILRQATNSEREKMLQVYYPQPGKSNTLPRMFEHANLEECLKEKRYLIVLNTACLKMEPNDPDFIRVTHRTYEYINEQKDFDLLWSTRFFGPMVFYLVWYQKLDNIIAHMLNNSNLAGCTDLIKLYFIIYEGENKTRRLVNENTSELELIEKFIKNDLKNGASAELALRNYLKNSKTNQKMAAQS